METEFFLPGAGGLHVYVRVWTLSCFQSYYYYTQTFRRALTALVDSCAEIKSANAFNGVTGSGRVWRKVPESNTWSVLSIPLHHILHVTSMG